MNYRTNCKNCGAILHYNKDKYGTSTQCDYCGTEYHIDLLGRIEEYKIKIEFMGKVREYYIGDWENHPIYFNAYRDIDGRLNYRKPIYKTKLTLIEI